MTVVYRTAGLCDFRQVCLGHGGDPIQIRSVGIHRAPAVYEEDRKGLGIVETSE